MSMCLISVRMHTCTTRSIYSQASDPNDYAFRTNCVLYELNLRSLVFPFNSAFRSFYLNRKTNDGTFCWIDTVTSFYTWQYHWDATNALHRDDKTMNRDQFLGMPTIENPKFFRKLWLCHTVVLFCVSSNLQLLKVRKTNDKGQHLKANSKQVCLDRTRRLIYVRELVGTYVVGI